MNSFHPWRLNRRLAAVTVSLGVSVVLLVSPTTSSQGASADSTREPTHLPARISRSVVAPTTAVSWITFIPQERIGAPSHGCDYGSKYQFGGDGHADFDWTTSRYRTALHALIDWKHKTVKGYRSIGSSHVYRKSSGRLVETRTASTKDMSVKKLGMDSNSVDIRFVLHATNPFCKGLGIGSLKFRGAIDGAITMKVRKDGYWEIRSGGYREMPNHYIYIYNGGHVSTVLADKYRSAGCLIGSLTCSLVDVTGYYGKFD